jgi:hypothetical protein
VLQGGEQRVVEGQGILALDPGGAEAA